MPDTSGPSAGPITRRTVLQLALVAALGGALGSGAAVFATHRGPAIPPRFRTLTDDEGMLLIALCEQIIPRDDAPGATDAGVVHYIDRQLAGPLKRHLSAYRGGLAAVQATCHQVHGGAFTGLTFDQQTALLKDLEGGRVPKGLWSEPSPQHFMGLLISHTMQGFYGSPRHGGNRDHASHRMLGLAYPNIIGQNRYAVTGG